MHDPVADLLTRIRNGQRAKHQTVTMNSSRLKEEIVKVLKSEGYILDYQVTSEKNNIKTLTVDLKYYHGRPVIERILRISRPGLRVYTPHKSIEPVPGFGIAILSTSKGVMSHAVAKKQGIGGEVLCEVA